MAVATAKQGALTGGHVSLRLARASDAEEIARFYAPYALGTAINFEYEAPDAVEFARRIETVEKTYPFIVAVERGGEGSASTERVVGYAFASPMGARPAYGWSIDTSIYLDRSVRGRGIGTALYAGLEAVLREQGVVNIFACITVRGDDDLHDLPASAVGELGAVSKECGSAGVQSVDDPHLPLASPRFHAAKGFHVVGREIGCGYKLGRWYDKLWMEKQLASRNSAPTPVTLLSDLPAGEVERLLLSATVLGKRRMP